MIKKEEHRRTMALVLAHTGWWGSVLLLVVIISMGGSKPAGNAPPWLGLVFIILMGVGIAAGSALSRMRLARTIEMAFERGYTLVRAMDANKVHTPPTLGQYKDDHKE